MRILLTTGKASSLKNVTRDIAHVLMKRGHVPRLITRRMSFYEVEDMCDGIVFVYPASPLFSASYFLLYRDIKAYTEMPRLFYTTLEGRPTRYLVKPWMIRDVDFIANSKFTYEKLTEAGFEVRDVVYHGIHIDYVKEALKYVDKIRDRLKRKYGDKVIFGVLAFWHKRKGLNLLGKAIELLSKKRDDFIVHLVTNRESLKPLRGVSNIYIDISFGMKSREEVLAFLGALDYLIVPSLAEGFCLPLLEANSMGIPVVHCLYPPLSEISDVKNNITFDYDDIVIEELGEGIDYELHYYNPKILAEAMEYALDLRLYDEDDYIKRRNGVRKMIRKFNADKLYKRLVDLLMKVE